MAFGSTNQEIYIFKSIHNSVKKDKKTIPRNPNSLLGRPGKLPRPRDARAQPSFATQEPALIGRPHLSTAPRQRRWLDGASSPATCFSVKPTPPSRSPCRPTPRHSFSPPLLHRSSLTVVHGRRRRAAHVDGQRLGDFPHLTTNRTNSRLGHLKS
jgi:hypothetical protein